VNAAAAPASEIQLLDRRRVYIFPSRPGFILALMLIIILLGAINYDNALAYLLAFLLSGLVMVAMLHTFANLAGLRFLGARAEPVFVGDRAQFECLLDNDSGRHRLQLFLKHWPRKLNRHQRRYLRQFETRFNISARTLGSASVAVDAERRGWLALERVTLHSQFPLGILRAWAYFQSDARCLVYPLPRGDLPLPVASAAATGSAAQTDLGNDDFAGLRPYRPGDPVRAIAWKSLAKDQQLMVKRFHGQTTARLWLEWSAVSAISGTEARLSQLTAWVLEEEQRGSSYGLDIPDIHIEFGYGQQHRDACLRALALFKPRV
jgi:uncharacterized protein (DUF58 family)